jgi:hypothetical protein
LLAWQMPIQAYLLLTVCSLQLLLVPSSHFQATCFTVCFFTTLIGFQSSHSACYFVGRKLNRTSCCHWKCSLRPLICFQCAHLLRRCVYLAWVRGYYGG